MAVLFTPSLDRAVDSSGNPVAGAKLYTYLTETTTPQVAYTDGEGTVPATNPLVADAEGMFEPLFLEEGVTYRVKLTNSTGSETHYDVDPVIVGIATLISGEGSALIGFAQSGVGAVTRSVQAKLRDTLSVEDFGAVGDGTTDDTDAIKAAFNTGRSVAFTSGHSYKITGTVDFTADGQKAFFNGCTVTGVGNFDMFRITGGLHSCAIFDPVFEGASMTGGNLIKIATADRTTLSGIRAHNPYNVLYAEEANLVHCQDWWINNIRGAHGIHWYGSTTKRSDVLQLVGITMSSSHTSIGVLWDGNCHTLAMQAVRLVSCSVGLQVQNASGGPTPAFLLADGLEIDFPQSHGVDLLVGEDFYFSPLFYCHGSATGSGIRINAAVPHDRVIVAGGKITGHAQWGIANPSTRVKGGHFVSFGNTSGSVEGDIYLRSERLEVDDQFYSTLSSSNPIINWDTGDSDLYDRTSNIRSFDIASVSRMRLINAANAVQIYVNGGLKTIEVGAADSGGVGYRMLRVLN